VAEHQLQWSAVASSSHSDDGGPVQAVLDGLEGEISDNGESEGCQQTPVKRLQGDTELAVGAQCLENIVGDPFDNTTVRLSISSNVETDIETEENFVPGESVVVQGPILLDNGYQLGQQEVGLLWGDDVNRSPNKTTVGPFSVGPSCSPTPHAVVGLKEPLIVASPSPSSGSLNLGNKGQLTNVPLIEIFDKLLQKSRGKQTNTQSPQSINKNQYLLLQNPSGIAKLRCTFLFQIWWGINA
jgi:hypothetical protein